MMMAFIDGHREDLGIEPICRELAIAPSSYHEHAAASPILAGVLSELGGMTSKVRAGSNNQVRPLRVVLTDGEASDYADTDTQTPTRRQVEYYLT